MRRHDSAHVTGMVIALALIGGCSAPSQLGSAPTTTPAPAPARSSAPPQPVGPDERACASVKASLAHLTANTSHWSPTLKPFDPAIAGQIARTARDLTGEAPTARTSAVRKAVTDNARTFHDLAAAMTHKDRVAFGKSITGTRVSYRELKKVCQY